MQALASGMPGSEEEKGREPPVALHEDLPVGQSLKKRAAFVMSLGDINGYMVTYTRVEAQQEVTPP